jgi:hypothetical protein
MRVLHLPVNVASHLAATVHGERAIGVDARGLVLTGSTAVQAHEGVDVLSGEPSRRSLRWWRDVTPCLGRLGRAIAWADVVHYYMTPALPLGADLALVRARGKPGVVEFSGGDIRDPVLESTDNPYYAARGPGYEYLAMETPANSRRTQRRFAAAGLEVTLPCPSMELYLRRDLFPHVHGVRQRVLLSELEPAYPEPAVARPLVVHAASAPVCKGTAAVVAAVEELRRRGREFEFVALDRVPRAEALAWMGRADVYVDQLVIGAHGSAAIEAMALGKPTVCYVKPSMEGRYPADLPLVNATKETLAEVLDGLLADGVRRRELGVRGRAYAERHHDAVGLAHELAAVYEAVLSRASSRSRRAGARGGGARRPSPGREAGP